VPQRAALTRRPIRHAHPACPAALLSSCETSSRQGSGRGAASTARRPSVPAPDWGRRGVPRRGRRSPRNAGVGGRKPLNYLCVIQGPVLSTGLPGTSSRAGRYCHWWFGDPRRPEQSARNDPPLRGCSTAADLLALQVAVGDEPALRAPDQALGEVGQVGQLGRGHAVEHRPVLLSDLRHGGEHMPDGVSGQAGGGRDFDPPSSLGKRDGHDRPPADRGAYWSGRTARQWVIMVGSSLSRE
jgi:hypothetical protein